MTSNASSIDGLYKKGALAAYQNSLELLEDANILMKQDRFARAYALGVLSLEEFAKAFLYRCRSVGLITDPEFDRDITFHKEKVFHAIHLLATAYAAGPDSMFAKVVKHDRKFSNHSKHLLLKEAPKIADENLSRVIKVIKVFGDSHELKLNGIYTEVDRKHGKVVIPKQKVKAADCRLMLSFLNAYMNGFEIILNSDDKRFRKTVEWIDPQILSGTMKSDFEKYHK